MLILENRMPTSAKQFIVLPASDLLGVEARYYSKHPEKYVFLVELRSNNSVSWNSRTAMNLGQYSPMLFWTLDDLKAHVRETALVDPSQEAIAAVEQSGYKMRITGRIDGGLEVVSVE
jgi:hypothetical protein